MTPSASIVIPTRARPDYLEVALGSIAPQAEDAGAEVLVIDDAGPSSATRALVERLGARYEPHPRPLGLNIARNTGVERTSGELVVFVDDDVRVRPGWLAALLGAAREHPDVDVFTGPIEPRLEGGGAWGPIHACGREGPPITSLQLGAHDADTRYAWGANMTIRRSALQRVGPFEAALEYGGDEQEWQDRLRMGTPGARVLICGRCRARSPSRRCRRAGALARTRCLRAGACQPALRQLARRGAVAWTRAAHARWLPRPRAPRPLPRRPGVGRTQRRAPTREPAGTGRRSQRPRDEPGDRRDERFFGKRIGRGGRGSARRFPLRRERRRRRRRCDPPGDA